MLVISLLLALVAVSAAPHPRTNASSSREAGVKAGAPILVFTFSPLSNKSGEYAPCHHICNWMGSFYPDSTPLVEMNVPGTHDTSTVREYEQHS